MFEDSASTSVNKDDSAALARSLTVLLRDFRSHRPDEPGLWWKHFDAEGCRYWHAFVRKVDAAYAEHGDTGSAIACEVADVIINHLPVEGVRVALTDEQLQAVRREAHPESYPPPLPAVRAHVPPPPAVPLPRPTLALVPPLPKLPAAATKPERTFIRTAHASRHWLLLGDKVQWAHVERDLALALGHVPPGAPVAIWSYGPIIDGLNGAHADLLQGRAASLHVYGRKGEADDSDRAVVSIGTPRRGGADLLDAADRNRDALGQLDGIHTGRRPHVHVGQVDPFDHAQAYVPRAVVVRAIGRPKLGDRQPVRGIGRPKRVGVVDGQAVVVAFVARHGSQRAAARALGCDQKALGKYLHGERAPTASQFDAMRAAPALTLAA